jgi:hypothetical protein
MAATNNNHISWIDYYVRESSGGGSLAKITKEPLSFFDEIADSYFEDEEGFHTQVGANPRNFIILPGPLRSVRMLHNAFITNHGGRNTPTIVGVWGTRMSSPFKEISKSATAPLRVPITRRSLAEAKVPSLEEFLECGSGLDFQQLEGKDSDRLVASLAMKPNSFWVHPTTFIAFGGPQHYRASALAIRVIASLRDSEDELSQPSVDARGLYNLLVFLWAVEKGYSASVLISDPPDTDDFDAACQEATSRLEVPSPARGRGASAS